MRSAPVVVLVAALVSLAGSARAQTVTLEEITAAVENQEYGDAHEAVLALLDGGGLEGPDLVTAYRALAECSAALRLPDEAQDAFVRLLVVDPDYALPELASPLVTQPFEAAQEFWSTRQRPTLEYAPPRVHEEGPLVISPEILPGDMPGLMSTVVVHLLRQDGSFEEHLITADQPLEMTEDMLEDVQEVSFHITARDVRGNTFAALGTAAEPLTVPIESRRRGGGQWYRRWWVWTIVGAVAVGLTLGLSLGLTADQWSGDPCRASIGRACDQTVEIGAQ